MDVCANRVLIHSPLLVGIDVYSFKEICSAIIYRNFSKGERIVAEGNPCTSIGVVITGQIAVQRISSSGDFATISLLSQGDYFGQELIFSTESVYGTTLEAMSSCRVAFLTKERINFLIEKCPVVKDNYLRLLSDKLKNQNRRIELLSQKTIREKIAYYLIELFNEQIDDSISRTCQTCDCLGTEKCKYPSEARNVELPVAKEVVAKYLAMPRPSFSRELIAMERDGLIKVNGRVITLCDVARLETEIVEGLASNN